MRGLDFYKEVSDHFHRKILLGGTFDVFITDLARNCIFERASETQSGVTPGVIIKQK